jgi:IMP cyclohydrolase
VPKLPAKALAAGLALAIVACTSVAPPTPRPSAVFIIPTELPNGRVEMTVAPSYPLGAVAVIAVRIVVTQGSVTGPLAARVMASGINEGGAPAEVLVRELLVKPTVVAANTRASTTLTWDTRDAKGIVVPPDAYTLVIEVRSDDGVSRVVTASATLELR